VPIVVRENQLVGMLAQADVARDGKEKATGEIVEAISRAPGGPRVAGSDSGRAAKTRTESSSREDLDPERTRR
jgi:hypothetical protein